MKSDKSYILYVEKKKILIKNKLKPSEIKF